jgi:hypothetical protein
MSHHCLSFNGAPQRASQVFAIKSAFRKIILNAVLYGIQYQLFVVSACQDNQWRYPARG